jgi:hypothetical protein
MLTGTLVNVMAHVPTWIVAFVLTVAAEIFAVGLMLLTRAISGLDRLKQNNEVAGFKFAVVGVFYGVLLAFVVVSVWEEYRGTETAVRDEAKAIVDLYHVSAALPFEAGVQIRRLLFTYTDHVRKYEWRTMARGKSSEDAGNDLESLSSAIFELEPQGYRQLMLYQAALKLLAVIADNRSERLDSADGSMSGLLWFVLIVGASVTLGYPAFFRRIESDCADADDSGASGARRALASAGGCLRLSLHGEREDLAPTLRPSTRGDAARYTFALASLLDAGDDAMNALLGRCS